MHLDGPVPYIRWEKGVQKNKRLMVVALAPELADALARHREAMKHLSRRQPTVTRLIRHPTTGRVSRVCLPVDPDKPGSPMFTSKPPRDVFRKDRERAEIPYLDERGRMFSPHSARKFFKTMLVSLGVSHDMSEYLMRHSPKVAGRYFDPSLEDQAAALARFPRLLSVAQPTNPKAPAHKVRKKSPKSLDVGGEIADAHGVTAMRTHPTKPLESVPSASLRVVHGRDKSCHADGAVSSGFCGISPRTARVQAAAFAAKMGGNDAQALTRTVSRMLHNAAELVRYVGAISSTGGCHAADELRDERNDRDEADAGR